MNSPVAESAVTASIKPYSLAQIPMRRATRWVLEMAAGLEGGTVRMHMPSGHWVELGAGEPWLECFVEDERLFERVLAHGDIGFAESYLEGEWDSPQLSELLTLLARNRPVMQRAVYGSVWRLVGHRLMHLFRSNTRRGSRRNIEAHYDLGNDFYALWLDPSMTYSSALFAHEDQPLEAAQLNKYRTLLRDMGVQPGQHILEVGCGWGGLAEVATLEFGCQVTGLTLSPSQLAWAKARAKRRGFADRADFILRDYRDERGQYDHIVSIEMIEAVGERFWPRYFSQLSRCLKPGGRVGLQGITIDNALFDRYRRGTDFIQRYVFPGGMLPSPEALDQQAARSGLETVAVRSFGVDYARTLAAWRDRFEAQRPAVMAQGFDERFMRLWRFYLCYCEAGFLAGSTDVQQRILQHRA